jgi:hypothetical protein
MIVMRVEADCSTIGIRAFSIQSSFRSSQAISQIASSSLSHFPFLSIHYCARSIMTTSNVTDDDDDDLPILGTFDFLVVGAGPSAAGLIKALLANNDDAASPPTFTVAVVEQGGDDDNKSIQRDMRYWATASQGATPHVVATIGPGRRVFPVSLAVGLGGNTRVNAALVVPPAPDDLTALPFVTNVNEAQEAIDAILKCLPIQRSPPPAAARLPRRGGAEDNNNNNNKSTTVPETPHFWNVMTYPSVCCHVPCCVDKDGRRVTYYEALVPPLSHKNTTRNPIDTFLHSKVERIETTTGDRRGVSLIVRNVATSRLYRLYARRDVILCAGTVETPALLVASGLLENDAISPVVDHHVLPKIYLHGPRCRRPGGDNHPTTNGVSALTHYVTNRTGGKIQVGYHEGETLVDLVPYLVAAVTWFHITPPGTVWHQILLQFVQGLVTYTPLYYLLKYCVTVQTIFLMNPHSHGTLSIVPSSSKQQGRDEPQQEKRRRPPMLYRSDYDVTMDLRYLSDERDVDTFAEAWQQYNSSSLLDMDDDCWLVFPWTFSRTFARLFVLPYFHWMGTTSRHVDPDFRFVIPTTKTTNRPVTTADTTNHTDHAAASSSPLSVRVCDASILPGLSAPTALTCAALGYILGNRLRKELG